MDFNQLITAVITNGIGACCAAAILWFAYYRETKTLPELIRAFSTTQKETTIAFTTTQKDSQESFEARNNKIVDAFTTLIREERTVYQRWHEDNRTRLEAINKETREVRHAVLNLSQQIGLRQAVEAERAKQLHHDDT